LRHASSPAHPLGILSRVSSIPANVVSSAFHRSTGIPFLTCHIGCDNALHNGGGPAPDENNQCNMACNGDKSEICGGPYRLNLYSYLTCNSTSLGSPGWNFKGCFTDSVSARTLSVPVSVPGAMTVEFCQAGCKGLGYIYAGVEYGVECCKSAPFLDIEKLRVLTDFFKGVTVSCGIVAFQRLMEI